MKKIDSIQEIVIVCAGRTIRYFLTRKAVRNINISVKKDGRVLVSAGRLVERGEIDRFVAKKSDWIFYHLERFEKMRPVCRSYEDGEIYSYLGGLYVLEVYGSSKQRVELNGQGLCLFVRDTSDLESKRKLIKKWYKAQAENVLERVYDDVCARFGGLFGERFQLRIRTMKTRWGTCNTSSKKITLSPSLVFAPLPCIEYVALHELCHQRYLAHNKQFYGLLESLMPDWKLRKKTLNTEGTRYATLE